MSEFHDTLSCMFLASLEKKTDEIASPTMQW